MCDNVVQWCLENNTDKVGAEKAIGGSDEDFVQANRYGLRKDDARSPLYLKQGGFRMQIGVRARIPVVASFRERLCLLPAEIEIQRGDVEREADPAVCLNTRYSSKAEIEW